MTVLAVVWTLCAVVVASPARAAEPEFVKFCVVSSVDGGAESLVSIAERLLGDPGRSHEIFALNEGRPQADGVRVTDPSQISVGWLLVLPWDATGSDVHYGLLSDAPSPSATATPAGPTPHSDALAAPTAAGWARQAVGYDRAWGITRGAGVIIGVIDSGVDADVPQLANRVLAGADIVTGATHGDHDSVGTGTAMASIVAARPDETTGMTGIAPEARVFPVRLVSEAAPVADEKSATAIDVAVSAGVTVLVLGAVVDHHGPRTVAAIARAVARDVVVVAGAPSEVGGAETTPRPAGLLRVAAIGEASGGPAGAPASDVAAPGVSVAGLRPGGDVVVLSGAQYAAALVAGTVALVRATNPSLSGAKAADVVVTTTRDVDGWHVLDAAGAVAKAASLRGPDGPGESVVAMTWGVVAVVVAAAVGAVFMVRRRTRRRVTGPPSGPGR